MQVCDFDYWNFALTKVMLIANFAVVFFVFQSLYNFFISPDGTVCDMNKIIG